MNPIRLHPLTAALMLLSVIAGPSQIFGQTTQYIPSSAFAAVDCKPKEAIAQPSMEILPRELIKVFGKQQLDLDLLELTRVTLLVGEIKDPEMKDPPEFGLIARFATPQTLSSKITEQFEKTVIDGKPAYKDQHVSLILIDQNTILFGSHEFLRNMVSSDGATSSLISLMGETRSQDHINAYVVVEPVRALIKANLPDRRQIPPPFRDFLDVPDLVESISFRGDFSEQPVAEYTVRAVDDEATRKLQRLIAHGFDLGKNAALSAITTQMEIPEAYQEATLSYAERLSNYIETAIQPSVDGRDLVFDVNRGRGVGNIGTAGVLIGMLLPAVQQVREAARRTDSMNKLRQCVIASHNFLDANGHFPMNANYDEDGNPLLSWRVHLLPYMDQQALYAQFHLEEPWDSPHNIKLLEVMPQIYRNPNGSLSPEKTNYLAISGPGAVFDGNKPLKITDIADGSSNTAMFVEADDSRAVEWTRPRDLEFDPDDPLSGLGHLRPAGFVCALCDGSVRMISAQIDADVWKSFVLTNDGQ